MSDIITELGQVEKLTERNRELRKQIYDATKGEGLTPTYIDPPILNCAEPKDTAAFLLMENRALEDRLATEKENIAALRKEREQDANPEFV